MVATLAGCSPDREETVNNTVRTEPVATVAEPVSTSAGATTVASPMPTTTVAATVLASTTSEPTAADVPTDPEIEAIFAAALAANDEFQRQLFEGVADRDGLLRVMTPEYADEVEQLFQRLRRDGRRFAEGSINQRVALRVELFPDEDLVHVIYCRRNNSAEYATKGTRDVSDDQLVQADLEVVGQSMQLRRFDVGWLMEGEREVEEPSCGSAFF